MKLNNNLYIYIIKGLQSMANFTWGLSKWGSLPDLTFKLAYNITPTFLETIKSLIPLLCWVQGSNSCAHTSTYRRNALLMNLISQPKTQGPTRSPTNIRTASPARPVRRVVNQGFQSYHLWNQDSFCLNS